MSVLLSFSETLALSIFAFILTIASFPTTFALTHALAAVLISAVAAASCDEPV